jgi:type IV fimbrial biogenesis protein FimT
MLAGLGITGMQNLLQRGKDEAALNTMQHFLDDARSEAEIRHQTISVCHSSDQQTCDGRWSDGQLMFIDSERDGVVHDREQILAVNKMKSDRNELHVRSFPVFRDSLQFTPLAWASNDNGTVWYCHQGQRQPVWAIKINRMGSTHVVWPDKHGQIQDGSGDLLKC